MKQGREYSILTAEISKATFGLVPSDYKKLKGLSKPQENLRDHMTDLELIFTMLGEASTAEIARDKNAQGFPETRKRRLKEEQLREALERIWRAGRDERL